MPSIWQACMVMSPVVTERSANVYRKVLRQATALPGSLQQ